MLNDWMNKAIELEMKLKEERKKNSSRQSEPNRKIGHIPWGHSDSNVPRAEDVNPELLGSPLPSPEPSPTEESEDEDQSHTSTPTESLYTTPEELEEPDPGDGGVIVSSNCGSHHTENTRSCKNQKPADHCFPRRSAKLLHEMPKAPGI